MKTHAIIIVSLLVTAMVIASGLTSRQSAVGSRQPLKCIPLLDEQLEPTQNTVYTPAFRAAWTLLAGEILGEEVRTVNPIPLVDRLNDQFFRPSDLSDWVLEAGNVNEGIIEDIKQSLIYKFQQTDHSLDQFRSEKDAIICYARLVRAMAFKHPFESMDWHFMHAAGNSRIACFGIGKKRFNEDTDIKEMQEQVSIYDYRNPDDFIIRLETADPSMEIIIAKMEPEGTIKASYQSVSERMEQSVPEEFSNIDELIIPKIKLSSKRSFSELIHQHLANRGFEKWFFAVASQQVEFTLDESGALAEITGKIVKIKGPVSRIYALDKPFLLICREKGSDEPDMVAWIATPDVMNVLP
jgi:hypothetical protein